jgi:hypothetical protein
MVWMSPKCRGLSGRKKIKRIEPRPMAWAEEWHAFGAEPKAQRAGIPQPSPSGWICAAIYF